MTGRLFESRRRAWLMAGLAVGALAAAAPVTATAQVSHHIHISAGSLDAALQALAAQSHEELLYSSALVAGRKAPAVDGDLTTEQALQRLLGDTGIAIRRTRPAVYVLRQAAVASSPISTAPHDAQAAPGDGRPFGAEAADAGKSAITPTELPTAASSPPAATVSEIQVTGTHIRGASLSASPVKTLDRADLDSFGQFTVANALTTLPQVFNGQDTEQSRITADRQGNNPTSGTGVNLRGLGASATLVLVDGRRLGGAGVKGDFTDISTIPSIAVSRVDLLLDGASAIYGSDAVGGVVNIILRNDFNGAELRVQGGEGDGGKPNEEQFGGIYGRSWASGHFVAAYELYRHSALSAADRDFGATSDLRALGGSDFRATFAFPGNIVSVNPATRISVPFYAIPTGQAGIGLKPSNFVPGTTNLENQHRGLDLLPDQQRQGAYLEVNQTLGERVEVSGEAIYGYRRERVPLGEPTATLTVTAANPFFVSPIGATTEQIQYAFDQAPNPVGRNSEETISATSAAKVRLWGDWQSDSFVSFSQESEEIRTLNAVNTVILAEALGNSPDNPATAYSPARDGFFNPFNGQSGNTPAAVAAIRSGFSTTYLRQTVTTASTQADGSLMTLPGGPLKLAVGAQVRRQQFTQHGTSYTSTARPAVTSAPVADSRTVTSVYGEVRAPLFGPNNRRPGFEALEVTAALRWEHFSDFGDTTNPKVGIVWTPVPDLNLRTSYGRSFRAPGLRDLHDPQTNIPFAFAVPGGRVEGLVLSGGNPNLRPETAETYTAGLDWKPIGLPGLRASATAYSIRYEDRIDTPVTANIGNALTDPALTTFVQRLNPTNATDLATITALLASPATTGAALAFPANAYGAIVSIRNVNTGKLDVDGIDIEAGYAFDIAGGRIDLGLTGSDLLKFDQQVTPVAPALSRLGVVGFPARYRGRFTAGWARGNWTVGAAVNYTSAFHDMVGVHVEDFTTLDLSARVVGSSHTRWAGLSLSIVARNVFNSDPPFYNSPLTYGYDGANADVIGRFLGLQLTQHW